MAEMISKEQIKNIWGFSKEVGIDKENLYCMIERISNKDSMRKLTKLQANRLINELIAIKDKERKVKRRTDEAGRDDTVAMRRKIYALCEKLGWNDNNNRIDGFCKRMFDVEKIQWLDKRQCYMLIEALKDMVKRQ